MKVLVITLLLSFSLFAKDYTFDDCPFVGNTNSSIFHTKGCPNYPQMLVENKRSDNRKCFKTHIEAKTAGYRLARNCRSEVKVKFQ